MVARIFRLIKHSRNRPPVCHVQAFTKRPSGRNAVGSTMKTSYPRRFNASTRCRDVPTFLPIYRTEKGLTPRSLLKRSDTSSGHTVPSHQSIPRDEGPLHSYE